MIDQLGGWSSVEKAGKFHIHALYKAIRPQQEKVAWRRAICNNKATPRSVFVLWLAVQDRLATKDRLIKWHMQCDPVCVLCGKTAETLQHLFFVCDYSSEVWTKVLATLQFTLPCHQFEEALVLASKCGRKHTNKAQLFTMCYAEAIYGLWIERNNRIFRDIKQTAEYLANSILFNVAVRTSPQGRELLVP